MRNKFLLSALGGLLIAAGAGGIALAEMGHGGRHHGGNMFERLDLNKDGEVTREEAEAAREKNFTDADTDGDGFISMDEMEAMAAARAAERRQARFERMDKDKDGKLSRDELTSGGRGNHAERMFDHMDTDKDGKITRAEADAAREQMRERRGSHHRGGKDE